MLDRLRFLWAVWTRRGGLFRYDTTTGYGYGVSRYSLLRDQVLVRVSRFGYIDREEWRSRGHFNASGLPFWPPAPAQSPSTSDAEG